ncbi:hypothetical protein HID58_041120 [Brassica napus]|uniref:Uncharacterized protein n=1 Tax=Brassica napus TaxID=3708 RepID=A0ABQ8B9Y0_BRANA|nr:hypothetical protein HID58_041120 [Brassica napus]
MHIRQRLSQNFGYLWTIVWFLLLVVPSTISDVGYSCIKGSPLRGSFPGPGQVAGRLHPGGYVLSPKAQYPFRDMDEQFFSGWR